MLQVRTQKKSESDAESSASLHKCWIKFYCSHEIQRCLLLSHEIQSYNKLRQNIQKQRHHFADKGTYSERHGFSSSHVWLWELDYKESWALKNWCFSTVVLEKTLERVPWTARRSNQSILKEINPEHSVEGLMLKMKLQYFGHLLWSTNSFEKRWCWEWWKAGEGEDRGWDGWMASLTQWTWVWISSRRQWRTEKPGVLQSMGSQRVGHDWATEQQQLL